MAVIVDLPRKAEILTYGGDHMNFWRLVPAAFLVCAASAVLADTITVLNPSFEDQVFSTGTGTPYPYGTITDWTATTASPDGFNGNVSDGGAFGVYNPTTVSYPGGVPDGVNVAFLQGVANSVSISQTLSATLQANDTYTLTAWEGLRDDTGVLAPGLGCNGSNITLEAGGTVLNSLRNETTVTCPSTNGVFQEFTVTFNSAGVNPALLGENLGIVLTANGSGSIFEPAEIDFDKISLSDTLVSSGGGGGSAVPEPGMGIVMAGAMVAISAIYRRRQVAGRHEKSAVPSLQ
jgi:hypothetical protein